jgi:hypothetical protein
MQSKIGKQVKRELKMSSSKLRQELKSVNFGIKKPKKIEHASLCAESTFNSI